MTEISSSSSGGLDLKFLPRTAAQRRKVQALLISLRLAKPERPGPKKEKKQEEEEEEVSPWGSAANLGCCWLR